MATTMDINLRHEPTSPTADLREELNAASAKALELAEEYPDAEIKLNMTRPNPASRTQPDGQAPVVRWGIHLKARRDSAEIAD